MRANFQRDATCYLLSRYSSAYVIVSSVLPIALKPPPRNGGTKTGWGVGRAAEDERLEKSDSPILSWNATINNNNLVTRIRVRRVRKRSLFLTFVRAFSSLFLSFLSSFFFFSLILSPLFHFLPHSRFGAKEPAMLAHIVRNNNKVS